MKYIVPIGCIISAGVTLWGVAAPESLRTVSESESPLTINIEERPCGDAHQICTDITIQHELAESAAIVTHPHIHPQNTPGALETPTNIVAPVVAPREQAPTLDMQSYLRSWLRREVWVPALINGIACYYGVRYLDNNNKQLLRLGIAAIAVPAWYTIMRTQRMEHGIPSLVTGILGMELALAAASSD